MQKKYLVKVLAVAMSASMIFTACGESKETAAESEATGETQTEAAEQSSAAATEASTEAATEASAEVVAAVPVGEENQWEFCENLEPEIPFVAITSDENYDAAEFAGLSVEKGNCVYKFTNIEETPSDKAGMKKILVDYVFEGKYDVILNEKEYVEKPGMTTSWRVPTAKVCDYYSGMSAAYERKVKEGETTSAGQWNWEWEDQVYPITYECNTVADTTIDGLSWQKIDTNLYATHFSFSLEANVVIEAPEEYDGLVFMLPKEGAQEYSKLEDSAVEMKDAMLEDGRLRTPDEFYIYRISDIQEKVAEKKLADGENVEDFLAKNYIEIDSLPTMEMFQDDPICRAIFQGYMGEEENDGTFVAQYASIETESDQTIVKLYHSMGYSSISKEFNDYDYPYIVDFYDRYTGENILKTSDIHGTFDEGSKTLEAKDGFEVEVSFSPYKELSLDSENKWFMNEVTYTIHHAEGYDGLVVQVSGYDIPSIKEEQEAFDKDTYTLLDRPALLKRSYIYTATNE